MSGGHSPTREAKGEMFWTRRPSSVPVIDFDIDRIKALDVIDRVDTLRSFYVRKKALCLTSRVLILFAACIALSCGANACDSVKMIAKFRSCPGVSRS